MYTRCPTCSTCFRVTDRHLAIAKGKVRCGQCQLVFNAPENAIDDLPVNQLTPPITPKPTSTPLDTSPTIKKSPTSTQVKKVTPVAPTAKEKLEENIKEDKVEEIIEIAPVTEAAPEFDSNATMIADVSTLDKKEVEDINLDTSIKAHDTAFESNDEDDDDLFNDDFDINAAIDELTQETSESEQHDDITFSETDELTPIKDDDEASLPKDNDDDVFQTDAYDATSASSVEDILDEMEGQMSLDIAVPNDDIAAEEYDANKEFDFLKLDGKPDTKLKNEELEDNEIDAFEILEIDGEDNEPNNIKEEAIQEESFDADVDDKKIKDEYSNKEDELFNQIDLSDFEDSDANESIVLEEPDFANSQLQNIGQHAVDHDVPIQLRNNMGLLHSTSQRNWHPLLAPSFIIILLLISFFQLAFFRSHELVQQIPSSRPLLEALCEKINCNYSGPHDTKQIQLLSRDVRLHPKQKKALLISAAMINNANFSQPYPEIHVRLSDISGNVIAERIFNSKTYMGKLSNPFLLMKSKTPVHINFEVVDPGKDAINFEFTFL